ncbi:MAG TPA: hypothetical protein DEF34_02190 [Desulfotomaculum sp.]|nr:MAG: hypothetical protein VR67_06115 [Peptococcaceae bacterium BRH_c8a]KJS77523.1 MAG: hypothetical protein JL56_03285 [Desulfotomaculum sp. BICA1-6]HBX22436.1 hypothetical protein [Desulfotomaculum sp.]
MNENDLRILATFANVTIICVMLGSGTWVALDARKKGRTAAEIVSWFFFATMFILIGPLLYVLFRNKFYK